MHQNSSPSDGVAEEPLTAREAAFVTAFAATRNATKAAGAAGYSSRSAHVLGSRLLKKPSVAAAITAAVERIASKCSVTAERTVQEMAAIGFSDIRDYTVDGKPIADWLGLTPGAPDSAMRAIKRVRRKPVAINFVTKEGELRQEIAFETEIEFWSKDTQLKHLGDYFKLFKEKRADDPDEEQLTDEELKASVISILRGALERKRAALRSTERVAALSAGNASATQ
jgi:phage terminase small subunit